MKRTEEYIKECIIKDGDMADMRLVANVWFKTVRDYGTPEQLDATNAFCKLMMDGTVPMPQDILDKRDELLVDVKNW